MILSFKKLITTNRDYLFAIISQALSYVVPFTLIVYFSHIFPKEFIVLLFFTQALTQNFVSITDYGYAIRGSRIFALENDKNKLSEIANRIYMTKFILLSFSFFILFCIFLFSNYARNNLFFILGYMGVLIANVIFPGWAFIGQKRYEFIYLNNLAVYILLSGLTFFLVNKTIPFFIVALMYSFSFLLPAIAGFIFLKKELKIKFSLKVQLVWKELKEGFNIFLSSGIKGFYLSFPLTFLGIISNQHLLYNLSYPDKLTRLVVSFYNFIMRLSLPFFLEEGIVKKKERLFLLLMFSLIFVVSLICFKKNILMIVFNVKNIDFTYELLMISLFLKLVYIYIMYSYFFAYQRDSVIWKIFLIGLAVLSVFMVFSIKMDISAGYGILLSDLIILSLMIKFWQREKCKL